MEDDYLITGVLNPDGVARPRLNIIEFADPNHPDESVRRQWNLYLIALQTFYEEGTTASLGFYQIAGIHGAPFIHWVEKPQPGDRPGDYCTHGTSLFLTWHRPYLILFEQRIVGYALKYASQLSEAHRATYTEDAGKLRVPYWDWAADYKLPGPVRERQTKITLPRPGESGPATTWEIKNPLYSYELKDELLRWRDFSLLESDWWTTYDETKRCPDWQLKSRPEIVDWQLSKPSLNYRHGVYDLLTGVHTYGRFSNTGWHREHPTDVGASLESYHNSIHNFVGTDFSLKPQGDHEPPLGHMTEVPISAFDPIFWLHHANIDRIYAMWQAINPTAAFEAQKANPTRLPPIESLQTQDTPSTTLRPFYRRKEPTGEYVYWDNSMVQCTSDELKPRVFDYGYTYPEMPNSLRDDETGLKNNVLQAVNTLYGTPNPETFHEVKELPEGAPRDVLPLLKDLGISLKHANLTTLGDHVKLDQPLDLGFYRRTWTVSLKVQRFLARGNFTIFFFLGYPVEDPSQWIGSDNLVGHFSTFKSEADKCTNCARMKAEDAMMRGSIDITDAVYAAKQKIRFDTLDDVDTINAYLGTHLKYRALDHLTRASIPLEHTANTTQDGISVSVDNFLVPYPLMPAATTKLPHGQHPPHFISPQPDYPHRPDESLGDLPEPPQQNPPIDYSKFLFGRERQHKSITGGN